MKAVNLYMLTRYKGEEISLVENVMSDRNEILEIKKHEYESLCSLVEKLLDYEIEVGLLNGFFFSYTIEHIGKEFDLLKIDKGNIALNIELKSQDIGSDKMEQQLNNNRYYLSIVAKHIYSFTYVKETEMLYTLNHEHKIEKCSIDTLYDVLKGIPQYIDNNIEDVFRARDYLVSPLNTPDKFLNDEYFLTQQQEKIKREICGSVEKSYGKLICGISGEAGTGKTLLLFDLAKTMASYGKCCVIHSGILCEGHVYLDKQMKNITILSVKDEKDTKIQEYDYIFVDEMHRMKMDNYHDLLSRAKGKQLICSFDYKQTLSKEEENNNIPEKLRMLGNYTEYSLTNKIRTNKELMAFIRRLLYKKAINNNYYKYDNIDIVYANNYMEANKILELYKEKGYMIIGYSKSNYNSSVIDYYIKDADTHHVIGQEFDNVIVIMDENFAYDKDGRLAAWSHPNPNYLFYKLLFQAVSRAREKLCIVVCNNRQLFEDVVRIKYIKQR